MNSFNIIYGKHGKYSAIIYPVSYVNPIDDIKLISKELREHLPAGCYVLFDLLLSNGDNFNRFSEVYFDGNEINSGSISVTEIPTEELKKLNLYYRGKTKELSKSVLSTKEKYKYATMK